MITSRNGSLSLPRKLDDYLDAIPPKCDRCRNNGQLPGNFLVAILCKPCLLQVLADLELVTKINHDKRLVCPDCRSPVTFPRQVIFMNGRIKHSGRCESHGWQEWWLNEPRTVA
ncbi:MAG: hypothetical protein ACXAB4_11300 [Candidatus Hodarchaeales archaeon]|jgi:hypothetical protein